MTAEAWLLRGAHIRFNANPFDQPDALHYETDGAIAIEDGVITDIGPAQDVRSRNAGLRLETTQNLICPGFVDCHVHYPQVGVIASWGADLIDWLNRYTFPEEQRLADPAYAAEVARLYFDEQLRHGITGSASFCTTAPASVDAWFGEASRRGLRCVGGKVMMDRNAPEALCDTPQQGYDESLALIRRWHGTGRCSYAVTPRFAPTSTLEQLEAAGALWAEHPDCILQTHLAEQCREIEWVANLFPTASDYLDVYERAGLSGHGAVFGHAIHLTGRERAALASGGGAIAHCPTSNQFLGSGECAVQPLARAGVKVGLATDTGGGTSYSMLDTMKSGYEVSVRRGDRLTPVELWWLATAGSAAVLGLERKIGNLEVGLEADLIEIDPASTPLLARRAEATETIEELLFAVLMLGDDRAITRVVSGGRDVRSPNREE